ncbi:MAG: hypothetical protein AB1801_26730, partial [Chloroflexota bacterium]
PAPPAVPYHQGFTNLLHFPIETLTARFYNEDVLLPALQAFLKDNIDVQKNFLSAIKVAGSKVANL